MVTDAPIGCAEAVRRLWELVEDGLDVVDRRAVEAHLAWCRRCCGELAFVREMQQMLRRNTGGSPPSDVAHRLERLIDQLGDTTDEGIPT